MTAPAELRAAVEALAERDGCGCPDHLVQCVHFDGQILWLVEEAAILRSGVMDGLHAGHQGFGVGCGTKVVPCPCSPEHLVLDIRGDAFSNFDTLPEARAEFAERERKLLGREGA